MKMFKKTALYSAMSVILAACGGGDGDNSSTPVPTKTPTRTVLVYMVGSDLESGKKPDGTFKDEGGAATADLAEMMKVGSNANLNIVVETGGANKEGWKTVQRKLVKAGSIQTLADMGDKNMGESATLQDFLDWGMKTYPADSYTLVFWDHGGGAVGNAGATVGVDENHDDALSLPEIRAALQTATTVNGKKFDVIGFDTCLMATLETAHTIAPYADYMVASEETEPGTGWDYTAWLGAIKATPSISTLNISKTIVDSYFSSFATNDKQGKAITLSAIQLSKVPALTTALGTLAGKLDANLISAPDSMRLDMANSRKRSESYGNQNGDDVGMVDLQDFLHRLPARYASDVNNVKAKLDDVVAYNRQAVERPNAKGLSIYLPSENTIKDHDGLQQSLAAYKKIDFSIAWQTLVERYSIEADNDNTAPSLHNSQMLGSTLSVDINSQDTNSAHIYITHDNGDGTQLVLSREVADSLGGGKASYEFDNLILLVNGQYVYTEELESDEDNGLYTLGVPVMLNGSQSMIIIQAKVNDSSINFDVLGYIPNSVNGVVSRLLPLRTGDAINPLFLNVNTSTGDTALVTQSGNNFTVAATGMIVEIGQLPADQYFAFFEVEDYSGNVAYSEVFSLIVD